MRVCRCHVYAFPAHLSDLDRSFGVDEVWGEKAAGLRGACVQLRKLLGSPLLKGHDVKPAVNLNIGVLHGVAGHRNPVAAFSMRPRFPAQDLFCRCLHEELGACAARIGPHMWRPA